MSGRFSDTPESDRRAPRDPDDDELLDAEPDAEAETWTPEEDLGEPEVAEAVGETVEEAIQNALEILGAQEDEVEIEVLQTGQRGFLGFGKRRPFLVRATWLDDLDEETIEEEIPEEETARATAAPSSVSQETPRRASSREPEAPAGIPTRPSAAPTAPARVSDASPPPARAASAGNVNQLAERAREATEDLLRRMGMAATVQVTAADDEIHIAIESDEDDALLIGRRGETRAALEHLIQRLAVPREEREISVLVDVNSYWLRRIERLRSDAVNFAAEAVRDGQEVRTEPLSAQERRVIHRTLVDDERVSTESIGTGALKRVAIVPARSR